MRLDDIIRHRPVFTHPFPFDQVRKTRLPAELRDRFVHHLPKLVKCGVSTEVLSIAAPAVMCSHHGYRTLHHLEDIGDGDLFRGNGQTVSPRISAMGNDKAGMAQLIQDRFEESWWYVLIARNLRDGDRCSRATKGEFKKSPQGIVAFL